jgi:glycosyltransferase involved in cell wall biosynthesis
LVKSPSKGTNQIIDCWKKRPDFPHLNVYMSKNTYTNQYQQLEKDFIHGNIHLKPGLLDNIQFGKILAESSVILCPSYNEGYGHYINQAKAAGAVVVTTNGPPMNELITSKRGILIPVQPRKDKYQLLSGAFDGSNGLEGDYVGLQSWFDPKELCHAVEKILDLTPKQREQLAIAARRSYLQDMLFFQKSMNTLKAFIRFNASLA